MNANGRHCRKMANGYRHLARLGRPIYTRRSKAFQARKLALALAKSRSIAANKGKKGK